MSGILTNEDILEVDLAVVGAGAGGMTAALVGATLGLRCVIVEKTGLVGGTTAWSGGMVWIPANPLMAEAGLTDTPAAAEAYLDAAVGSVVGRDLRRAFIGAGPDAVAHLAQTSEVRFRSVDRYPDYAPDLPGATLGGRVLEPLPFDGRALGTDFDRIRPPLPEFTLFGGMMVSRADIPHLRSALRSPRSAARALALMAAYASQRVRHGRGTSLHLGNALVARLFTSLRRAGVDVLFDTQVTGLLAEGGRCTGLTARRGGRRMQVRAGAGVVLATGGFGHDENLRRTRMPSAVRDNSATVATATGDGRRLAAGLGVAFDDAMDDRGFWAPVSTYVTARGRRVVHPHTVTDRAKPGVIAVDRTGRRFVNEATPYHEFVRAMLQSPQGRALEAHLVCDATFLWRYGLGAIAPFTLALKPYRTAGYLLRGASLAELAGAIGVESAALEKTVSGYNGHAVRGEDPAFGRGGDVYQRHLGDAAHAPNPCVGPILRPPFYAIRLLPGDLGTAAGLAIDADARCLDASGQPIPGVFAVGNDAASIMRGDYPGPGITLGPALVFGYLAARFAASAR